jgi:hypothetical protein
MCRSCQQFVCDVDAQEFDEILYCRSCAPSVDVLLALNTPRPKKRRGGGGVRREWRPFAEARAFVHSLGLRSGAEWKKFVRGKLAVDKGPFPDDLPASPDNVASYRDEWTSWGDWLGTGRVADQLRVHRPFEEARAFARGLGLKSVLEWVRFARGKFPEKGLRPSDIPAHPSTVYEEWDCWGDWLGIGHRWRKSLRSFDEVRAFARSLGLKSGAQWRAFTRGAFASSKGKLPLDIPMAPWTVYPEEWRGWGDFLGTGRVANHLREYRPFVLAREFARGLGLSGQVEWRAFARGDLAEKGVLPSDIPSSPEHVYAGEWVSMGDWLGTGTVASTRREFRPFAEARAFVRALRLRTQTEWDAYSKGATPEKGKRPLDIPGNPAKVYREEGWDGIDDWLGVPRHFVPARPFDEAREFARSLGLRSAREWRTFSRGSMPEKGIRPKDVPGHPDAVYVGEWIGWWDWLGYTPRPRRGGRGRRRRSAA